jgi:long-chain acyl-CoA synthetase
MENKTIIGLLDQAAEKYANYSYASHKTQEGWQSFTYKQVKELSMRLAESLHSIGIRPDDSVAILSEGSPMWIIAEYAILSLGAISIPLSVKLLPSELPYRLNHSESKAIFVSWNNLDKVLSIYADLDYNQTKIIFLNDNVEEFHHKIQKTGIDPSLAFTYADLRQGDPNQTSTVQSIRNAIAPDDLVNISYTSGTTGDPKGIMLTHRNYYSNAMAGIGMFKLKERFRTLVILPVDHSFAHTVALYGALIKALDLYFLDTRGGTTSALKNIPINLQEVKPEFLLTVPALTGNFMQKMIDGVKEKGAFISAIFDRGLEAGIWLNGNGYTRPRGLMSVIKSIPYSIAKALIFKKLQRVFGGKLEYMVGGGALLDIKQQKFYKAIGAPVYQGYGLTEAAPIISANTPFQGKIGTSGKVMPNIEIRIMKDRNKVAKPGEVGEIVIRGENVMKGYFKNESASKKVLVDGWLWTGDLGYIDEDSFLVVTGRNKALLISSDGEKYSPEAIEEAILSSSEWIFQVVLYNNQKPFTTAVVTMDPLKKSLLSRHSSKEVLEGIQKDLKRISSDPIYRGKFPEKWLPSSFYVAPEPFTEENKMINSTLKVVRYKVYSTYEDSIELLYKRNVAEEMESINNTSIEAYLK